MAVVFVFWGKNKRIWRRNALLDRANLNLKLTSVFFLIATLFLNVGAYFLLLSFEILSQIVHSEEVDLHVLSGLISSFLMIGIAFASIYLSIYRLDNMAFSGVVANNHAPWLDMIYFSFATITTVGWGDIVAVNQFAKIVAILESIVGLIFNAIVISRFANVFWFKKK